MATIIQLRRDTAANWTANNPILADGEQGFETDTKKEKIGDGVTAWNSLIYKATTVITGKTLTGVALNLSNIAGNNYNYAAASSGLSYTTSNPVINGYAHCLINASSEPVVYETDGTTPATKINGATFTASTNMEMVVESKDGTNLRYFFLKL